MSMGDDRCDGAGVGNGRSRHLVFASRHTRIAVSALLGLTLLTGCATGGSESPDEAGGLSSTDPLAGADTSSASADQLAEISDSQVSAAEYDAAFQRYRDCLSRAGFELTDVDTSGDLYDFAIPGAAVEAGADEDCYQAEFQYVDSLWQSTPEILNNSLAAQDLRDCLSSLGFEPSDSVEAMEAQIREEQIDVSGCFG